MNSILKYLDISEIKSIAYCVGSIDLKPLRMELCDFLALAVVFDRRLDRLDEFNVVRSHGAAEAGHNLSVAIKQVLVEVPARKFSGLTGERLVQRTGTIASDPCFLEHWEFDAVG